VLKENRQTGFVPVVLAIVIGIFPAFFLVFNAIFSDSGDISEHFVILALVFVVYGVLGAAFGLAWPRLSYSWGAWLGIPALVLVAWYSIKESGLGPERLLLHAAYLVVAIGAGCLGGYAGARRRGA
jgi:hypothetical protein